jgi:hypothetical protein
VLKRVKESAIEAGFFEIFNKSVGSAGMALYILGTNPSTAHIAKN